MENLNNTTDPILVPFNSDDSWSDKDVVYIVDAAPTPAPAPPAESQSQKNTIQTEVQAEDAEEDTMQIEEEEETEKKSKRTLENSSPDSIKQEMIFHFRASRFGAGPSAAGPFGAGPSGERNIARPVKRIKNDNEWITVTSRKEKILQKQAEKIEMYVSSSEKMPKLFALAKIFKSYNLMFINKVKYISPFKVRIDVNYESEAQCLENCKGLTERGWRIRRAFEKNVSYGVVKNVDVELSDKEIMDGITCPNNEEVVSMYRLQRRVKGEDKWEPSESVRFCFKGPYLPPYVAVDGLRLKVDPYVFPVSQCAKCWKLGHTTKRCPSSKIICPKCGGEHENCETKTYRCINCDGNHMALAKTCPVFIKEKKLRYIMAEYNCTYRYALIMYVNPMHEDEEVNEGNNSSTHRENEVKPALDSVEQPTTPSFANVVKTKATIHKEEPRNAKKSKKVPNKKFTWSQVAEPMEAIDITSDSPELASSNGKKEDKNEKSPLFEELLFRLKEIIFLKGVSVKSKVKLVVKCCFEGLLIFIADYLPDWPMLIYLLDFING